jgi:hypothetical protein
MSNEIILNCGHALSEHGTLDTGYGTKSDGTTMCYDCITTEELNTIAAATRETSVRAYLTGGETGDTLGAARNAWTRDNRVTNWAGRKLFSHVIYVSGKDYGTKRYIRAVDMLGREWYGSGPREAGAYVTMHPVMSVPYLPSSIPFPRTTEVAY